MTGQTRKKWLLFDLDGTLFDSSEGIKGCYREALAHFGITVTDDRELDKIMGPSLYLSFHDFFGLCGDDVTEAVRIYRDRYNAEGIYQVKMYEGMDALLRDLHEEGHTVCLATTKPQVMAEKILAFSGLAPCFDIVCGSQLDGSRSDKVELIAEVLRQAVAAEGKPVNKSRVYMIGDRFYDMEGAVKAGVRGVGVTFGFGTEEELLTAGAECLADSAEELRALLLEEA